MLKQEGGQVENGKMAAMSQPGQASQATSSAVKDNSQAKATTG